MLESATTPLSVPDNTPIWRYMDLARFVSFAFSRRLWFPRLSELWLSDPWEGFSRARGLKRPSRTLPKGVPLDLDVGATICAEMSGYAAEVIRYAYKHVYAVSWCMGSESLAMWERYGAGAAGVAIESTAGRFQLSLERKVRVEQYAFGGVRYHDDLRKLRHDFRRGTVPASGTLWRLALHVGFNKRSFYGDEKEWRAAIFQEIPKRDVRGLEAPVDVAALIKSVPLGPRVDAPTRRAVAEVLRCNQIEVRSLNQGF